MAERTPQLDEMPQPLWLRTEAIIGRFEAAWTQGPPGDIAAFLPDDSAERGRLLIELVHIDLENRLKAGEAVRVERYLELHPELAQERPSGPRPAPHGIPVAPPQRTRAGAERR